MTTSPHERRDWFVQNHIKTARALGIEVDADEVARQAAKDLDAADKVVTHVRPPTEADDNPELAAKRQNVVNDAAAQRRAKVYERPATGAERVLPVLGGVDEQKRQAMFVRIKQLCTPIPEKLKPSELANGVGGMCEYPALANDIALHTYGYARGSTIHTTTGIVSYRGLSFDDRIRLYTRSLEDICDRSTALLGPWWVK